MPKQQHDDQAKADALAVLAANNGNLSAAARQTGIARKTIEYWARDTGMRSVPANDGKDGEQRRTGTESDRLSAIAMWQNVRGAALAEATKPEKVQAAGYRDLVVAAGISQDKLTLLTGGATHRLENNIRVSLVAPDGRTFGSLREASLAVLEGDVRELPAPGRPED